MTEEVVVDLQQLLQTREQPLLQQVMKQAGLVQLTYIQQGTADIQDHFVILMSLYT
jgi:hypothetical protein